MIIEFDINVALHDGVSEPYNTLSKGVNFQTMFYLEKMETTSYLFEPKTFVDAAVGKEQGKTILLIFKNNLEVKSLLFYAGYEIYFGKV